MPVSVSTACSCDAESIAVLFYQTSLIHYQNLPDIFTPPVYENNLKHIHESLGKENILIFKAEGNGQICGYLILYIDHLPKEFFVHPDRGFVGSIGVDPSFRGKGIGTKLIQAAEEYLKSQKMDLMEIDVYVFNTDAEKLYDRLGYTNIKHLKRKFLLP